MEKRNTGLVVLFTILTCGIYGIYWHVVTINETTHLDDEWKTSGGTVVLLSIVTLGIYGLFSTYKMGRRLEKNGSGIPAALLVVLALFGWIISAILINLSINHIIDDKALAKKAPTKPKA